MRVGMAGDTGELTGKERMHREDWPRMAKIIEFYIPSNFRKNDKWIPPQERGKIIEFSLPAKKSA
jgi:hypothetical protein